VFATGGAHFQGPTHDQHIAGQLDGIEIVDIKPDGLESAAECYAALVTKLTVLPQVAARTIQDVEALMGARVTIQPTPVSAALPNNPALEDEQLKAFLDIEVTIPKPSGGGGGSGGPPPPPPGSTPTAPGVDLPRVRVGPFDGTLALSQRAVTELFNAIRDAFHFSKSDEADFGPFTMGYAIGLHLAGGTVTLRNDGTIRVKKLDVKFDTAKVFIGIDIPEVCVGGFCIIPTPLGCAVRAPKICAFSDKPDFGIKLDISGLITSEISVTFRPVAKYSRNHPSAMNAWDARTAGTPNKWIVIGDIISLDFDLFDIADIVGDLLRNELNSAIDNLLGPLPGWAKSFILSLLGPIIDIVVNILDLPDDVGEWIADKLGFSFGLFDLILTAIANSLAGDNPLVEIEEPVKLLSSDKGLIDVLLPVEFLGVRVNADEMVVEADIGD
jgi:hypothetical protein